MAEVNPYLSVITVNVNGLNSNQKTENGRMDKTTTTTTKT